MASHGRVSMGLATGVIFLILWTLATGERSAAQYGYMGDSATLLCRNASAVIENIMIQTHTIPSIKWHKSRHQSTDHTMWDTVAMVTTDSDGSPILTLLGDLLNERASVELTSGNLTVFQLELWDESAYWCDIAGSHTDFVDLKVYVKPSAPIITGLQDPFLLSAQPTITCTVEQVKPENATVLWRREGELEELDSLAEVTVGEAGVATVVSRFTGSFDVADNGRTLQCIAMPGMDAEEYTVMTSVVIRLTGSAPSGAPMLRTHVSLIWIGQEASLFCDINTLADIGEPEPTWTLWKKDGEILGQSIGFSLTLVARDINQNGNYTCQVGNALSPSAPSGESNAVYIAVKAPLQVEEPRTESTRNWVYGQDLSLECAFSGSDIQQILWHTTSTSVNVSMYHASVTERGGDYGSGQSQAISSMLHLGQFSNKHCSALTGLAGDYHCSAHTPHATLNGPYIGIRLKYPPIWNGSAGLLYHAALNKTVTLSCDVCANPPPTKYHWSYSNGTNLRPGITVPAKTITITNVQSIDFDVYRCTAFASIANVSFDLHLLERGAPYTVTSLRTTDVGSRSLTVHWCPGYDGGYPNMTYNLRISDVTTDDYRLISGVRADCDSDVSYNVSGMTTETEYSVEVQAVNHRPSTEGNNTSDWNKVLVRTKASPSVSITNVHIDNDWSASVTWRYDYANEHDVVVDPDVVGIRVLYSWDDGPWFESPMNGSLWQMTESLATFPIYNLQHKLQVQLLVYEYYRFAYRTELYRYRSAAYIPDTIILASSFSIIFCISTAIILAICIILKRKQLYISCRCCCVLEKFQTKSGNDGTRKNSEAPVLDRPEHESQVYEEIPEQTYADVYLTPVVRAPPYLNLERGRVSQISSHETFT